MILQPRARQEVNESWLSFHLDRELEIFIFRIQIIREKTMIPQFSKNNYPLKLKLLRKAQLSWFSAGYD